MPKGVYERKNPSNGKYDKKERHCEKHGMYMMSDYDLARGRGCPKCGNERSQKARIAAGYETARKAQKKYYEAMRKPYPSWFIDIIRDDKDKNRAKFGTLTSKDRIWFKCKYGHEYEALVGTEIRITSGEKYEGCPECARLIRCEGSSYFEKDVREYVYSITEEPCRCNDRSVIKIRDKWCELDIYFPSLNKAIECDGEYWHEEVYDTYEEYLSDLSNRNENRYATKKWKGYHKEKDEACKELGISLLHVNYSDWIKDKEACKERIKNFIFSVS